MKPVIHVTIGKNGEEQITFNPSARMLIFAMKKSENQDKSDQDVAELCGLDRQLPGRWATKYGSHYLAWIEDFIDSSPSGNDAALLERVGMIQALQGNNYSYWKDMARKHGVIKDEVRETTNIQINTDFSAILVGDPDEARRRILQEIRGVVTPRGLGVATSPRIEQPQGAGSGASPLQVESVAVSNTLDSDRGRAKRRAPLPTVPEQATPASPDGVLAKRKVPSRPKK